ncbi:MAG: endolytic transglycosylase MltG [Dehalococcoidia bacterium]|nr:endolytic transglycosylase MltG [Dehalococcoidia bacterium]
MLMIARNQLIIACVLLSVFLLGIGYWVIETLAETPENIVMNIEDLSLKNQTQGQSIDTVEINIPEGSGVEEIIQILVNAEVINDESRFRILMTFGNFGSELQAGSYQFKKGMPAAEVLFFLRQGGIVADLVRIPEGLRLIEVGQILHDAEVVDIQDWQDTLSQDWLHIAISSKPPGSSLLGYLLPASYPFREGTTAKVAIKSMLDAFSEQVSPELMILAGENGMTLHEVVTLASIVEREVVLIEEMPIVASVFINRLNQDILLGADPTVQFAVSNAESVEKYGWWKSYLDFDDLEVVSPYNTYLNLGLPPGPIANPGVAAIEAVIKPADTDYIYFVASPECDGSHLFSSSYSGHLRNVDKFKQSSCGALY